MERPELMAELDQVVQRLTAVRDALEKEDLPALTRAMNDLQTSRPVALLGELEDMVKDCWRKPVPSL